MHLPYYFLLVDFSEEQGLLELV